MDLNFNIELAVKMTRGKINRIYELDTLIEGLMVKGLITSDQYNLLTDKFENALLQQYGKETIEGLYNKYNSLY